MGDFVVRYNNFSGGDWGITADDKAWNYRRGHVLYNEFSATNMAVYPSGLLGVRAGWKKLDTTGKATGLPASYTGAIRGFDVMGNKLMLATADKTYDVYWDLSLAVPPGVVPANAPIPLPSGIAAVDHAQFLRGADSTMKEFLLIGGKLYYRTGDPAGAWTLTGPAGVNLSVVTRWNLYLVAVDKDRPWIIWFSQVDDSGPNFLTWPAANFLFVGTTEPITTLLSIFNQLYAGRTSGWWGISGVLGIAASVRELAMGNGPLDQRAASVTTDNRIAYWPVQKVPAFWNGGGVQLVPTQRMDPRVTFADLTPAWAKTAPAAPTIIPIGPGWNELDLSSVVRQAGATWASAPGNPTANVEVLFQRGPLGGATMIVNPFGTTTAFAFPTQAIPPVGWTVSGDNKTFTCVTAGTYMIEATAQVWSDDDPPWSLNVLLDSVQVGSATSRNKPGYRTVSLVVAVTAGQKLTVGAYNPGAQVTLAGSGTDLQIWTVTPAATAGRRWVCPATGQYNLTAKVTLPGGFAQWVYLMVNGRPNLNADEMMPPSPVVNFTVNLSAPNTQLTAGDQVSLMVLGARTTGSGSIGHTAGPENVADPLLTSAAASLVVDPSQLGIPGDQVVVTPTYRRLMFLGDDGTTSKIWSYGATGIWTHDEIPVLVGGMAPSDVRNAYLLPERVVFATQRTYNNEAFPNIWSVVHDLDRPALMSDQWSSPYDQAMSTAPPVIASQGKINSGFSTPQEQGVLASPTLIAQQVALMTDLGVGWHRSDYPVKTISPTSGTFDYSVADQWITADLAAGIIPLPVLYILPTWMNGSANDKTPPTSNATFASWCATACTHLWSLGVRQVEIWNEPNLSTFWNVPAVTDANYRVAYANLMAAVYPAIKAAVPGMTVVLGGLSTSDTVFQTLGTPSPPGKGALSTFQRYGELGVYANCDAVAWHPYLDTDLPCVDVGGWPAMNLASAQAVLAILDTYAPGRHLKLWTTETGAPRSVPISQAEQSNRAHNVYATIMPGGCMESIRSRMGPILWFTVIDRPAGGAREQSFGFVSNDQATHYQVYNDMKSYWATAWPDATAGPPTPGDVLVQGQVHMAAWYDSQGRQVRVRTVEVIFRKWDQGIVGGTNKITARVDSHAAYDRGTTQGAEATWEEPMTSASPDGTEDSWRFNIGEQGFGNGFQVVFTGLYGVALREVNVTVDIRTERA